MATTEAGMAGPAGAAREVERELSVAALVDEVYFLFEFALSPSRAVAPFLALEDPRTITKALTVQLVNGLLLAYACVLVADGLGLDLFPTWVDRLEPATGGGEWTLPVLVVGVLMLLGVAVHGVLWTGHALWRLSLRLAPDPASAPSARLGPVGHTVNATLAFACFYIPILFASALLFLAPLAEAGVSSPLPAWAWVLVAAFLVVAAVLPYGWALATLKAFHGLRAYDLVFLVGAPVVLGMIGLEVLSWIV